MRKLQMILKLSVNVNSDEKVCQDVFSTGFE